MNRELLLMCAFCDFQAEHHWVVQIRQRRSPKTRFMVWGGLSLDQVNFSNLYLSLRDKDAPYNRWYN